jgi:hypothetical protein
MLLFYLPLLNKWSRLMRYPLCAYTCVCLSNHFNVWSSWPHKIWYRHYATGGHSNVVSLNLLQSVITTWRSSELVSCLIQSSEMMCGNIDRKNIPLLLRHWQCFCRTKITEWLPHEICGPHLVFGFMAMVPESVELDVWNLVRRQTTNILNKLFMRWCL